MLRVGIRAHAARYIQSSLVGWLALIWAASAVALPTLFRAMLNGVVTGCEFTIYVPFVLLSAIVLRWWQAGAVALASVAIMGGLFEGSLLDPVPCFVPAAGTFVVTSAIVIGITVLLKHLIAVHHGSNGSAGGVIFSLEKGHVWASWYGQAAPVRLGTRREVSYMMKDFLAQEEVAKRLGRQP